MTVLTVVVGAASLMACKSAAHIAFPLCYKCTNQPFFVHGIGKYVSCLFKLSPVQKPRITGNEHLAQTDQQPSL